MHCIVHDLDGSTNVPLPVFAKFFLAADTTNHGMRLASRPPPNHRPTAAPKRKKQKAARPPPNRRPTAAPKRKKQKAARPPPDRRPKTQKAKSRPAAARPPPDRRPNTQKAKSRPDCYLALSGAIPSCASTRTGATMKEPGMCKERGFQFYSVQFFSGLYAPVTSRCTRKRWMTPSEAPRRYRPDSSRFLARFLLALRRAKARR